MLDGAARVDELVSQVAKEGMPAIAITDHGMFSAPMNLTRRPMLQA